VDKLLIKGGRPLFGSVGIGGAKNAALPAMAAALLTSEEVILNNIPCVRDIQTTGKLLAELGCVSDLKDLSRGHCCKITAAHVSSCEAP
jgi:UDP-N-acetylglucosamine 1-carboxyvinyltransferase